MSVVVLLDSSPLGMVTNPRASFVNAKCNQWLEDLLVKGIQVMIPEITAYEVRRELLQASPLPATLVIMPVFASIFLTQLFIESAIKMFDLLSKASPDGKAN